MLGYDKPLYLMAFDHRGSFEGRRQALAAGAPPSANGVPADEQFGSTAADGASR